MFRIAGGGPLRCRHFGLPSVTFHSQSKAAITLTPVSNCFAARVSQPFGGPLPNGEAPQNLAFRKDSIFWQGALVQAGRCGSSFTRCALSCGATTHSNSITRDARAVFSYLRTDIVRSRLMCLYSLAKWHVRPKVRQGCRSTDARKKASAFWANWAAAPKKTGPWPALGTIQSADRGIARCISSAISTG